MFFFVCKVNNYFYNLDETSHYKSGKSRKKVKKKIILRFVIKMMQKNLDDEKNNRNFVLEKRISPLYIPFAAHEFRAALIAFPRLFRRIAR